jgi:hypothetical protein
MEIIAASWMCGLCLSVLMFCHRGGKLQASYFYFPQNEKKNKNAPKLGK